MKLVKDRPGQPRDAKRYVDRDGIERIWFQRFSDALDDERDVVTMTPFHDGYRVRGTNMTYVVGADENGSVRRAVDAHNALVVG